VESYGHCDPRGRAASGSPAACASDTAYGTLAIAAARAPDVMQRVASTILAALDQLPARDRSLLLDTFGAWLDSGGSASQAASTLFCHPNTVRHRRRRLEQRTGRSLAHPREIAELSLAFEIDRRLAAPAVIRTATDD